MPPRGCMVLVLSRVPKFRECEVAMRLNVAGTRLIAHCQTVYLRRQYLKDAVS
jgi:hypothetical protein